MEDICMKKIVAVFLILIMLCPCFMAAAENGTISTGNYTAKAGSEFTVDLNLSHNPGVIGLSVLADYDSNYLELVSYKNGDVFDKIYVTSQTIDVNPYKVMWIYPLSSNITKTGKLISFTFKVKNSVKSGTSTEIKIYSDDSTNEDFEIIDFTTANIKVNITGSNTNGGGNVGVTIGGTGAKPQTGTSSTNSNSNNSYDSTVSADVSNTQSNINSSNVDGTLVEDIPSSDKNTENNSSNIQNDDIKTNSPLGIIFTALGVVAVAAVLTLVALKIRKNKAKDTKESQE